MSHEENEDTKQKEKRKAAVALKYEIEKDTAPKITASGKGELAEKILELAREYNIPIHEDEPLVELLSKLQVGEIIPPELYPVIAEILAWVYSLNKNYPNKKS